MKKVLINVFVVILLAHLCTAKDINAKEGFWHPEQFISAGYSLDVFSGPNTLKTSALNEAPYSSILQFNECSGAFISEEGLFITSYDCAESFLKRLEKPNLKEGFIAHTKTEEIGVHQSQSVKVTTEIEDVSETFKPAYDPQLTSEQQLQRYTELYSNTLKSCEMSGQFVCALVHPNHTRKVQLIKQKEINDIRLVYLPPLSLVKANNVYQQYSYPSHSANFALFRTYIPSTKQSAAIPYAPQSYLSIDQRGVREAQTLFSLSYPQQSFRFATSTEIVQAVEWGYPNKINYLADIIALIKQYGKKDNTLLEPYLKAYLNAQGVLFDLTENKWSQQRAKLETEFNHWIHSNNSRSHLKGTDKLLIELQEKAFTHQKKAFYYQAAKDSQLIKVALKIYQFIQLKTSLDEVRLNKLKEQVQAELEKLPRTTELDMHMWALGLSYYLEQEEELREKTLDKKLRLSSFDSKEKIVRTARRLYKQSNLMHRSRRFAWLEKSITDFEKSADPFIQLAVELSRIDNAYLIREQKLNWQLYDARHQYLLAFKAFKDKQFLDYYDANGQLRISLGKVTGYPAEDGIYKLPFTSLKGFIEQNNVDLPEKFVEQVSQQNFGTYTVDSLVPKVEQSWLCYIINCPELKTEPFNSIPINFISDLDSVNGCQGAPVLNEQGELVGLTIDLTYESLGSAWHYEQSQSRTIHLDIRYMLWMLDKVEKAYSLLEELDITR